MDPLYEKTFSGEHVSIKILKTKTLLRDHKYLHKNIPRYPENVEFHISKVSHVTNKAGLDGILPDGFKGGQRRGAFMWWDLNIDDIIITEAEKRYLDRQFPNRHSSSLQTEERQPQVSFLKKFTTSPVFQKGSRYGNFKFTFPLEDLMQMYTEQICEGEKPVLRVFETVVYKQEIMYVVVVHGPDVTEFDEYPLLADENDKAICIYKDGQIVWRAEAICETHTKKLIINRESGTVETEELGRGFEYFMWDNVTLAFHLPADRTLQVEEGVLKERLHACEGIRPFLQGEFLTLEEAEEVVNAIKNSI